MEFIWTYNTTLLDDTEINYTMEDEIDYDAIIEGMIERAIEESDYSKN